MNFFAFSGLIIIITALILTIALLSYGNTKLHKIWTLFNFAVLVWGIGCFLVGNASSPKSALFAWRIAISGGLFLGVLFYHTMSVFSDVIKRKTLICVYIQAVLFLLLTLTTELTLTNWQILFGSIYFPQATLLYTLMVAAWVIVVYLGHRQLVFVLKNSKGKLYTQAKYLFWGFLIGFLGGGTTLLPAFNINIYPIGNLGIPLYTMTVTYAILRHRLMDVHLVFKKSMVYSLSVGILTSLFVILVLAMTRFLSDMAGITSFAITVIAALLIAVLFNPLRIRIQNLVDKVFYKKSYDYYSIIRQVSSTLASMFDMQSIFKFTGNMIYEVMGLKGVCLLSPVSGSSFEIVYQTSRRHHKTKDRGEGKALRLSSRSETVRLCKKIKDIIIKDELPAVNVAIEPETIEKIKDELKPFHAEAVVPVFVDSKLSLLVIMGEKLSGDMFSSEDINLLGTIAEQAATAIKNARLYSDKVNTDRLASIGMMSATFAHEIRNPLTSLKTFAQLMPEKYNDAEFRGTFSKIVEGEIEKIDGLISDLLDFSTDKQTFGINNFNLVEVVDETVDYVKSKFDLEQKNIIIEKKFDENEINMSGDVTKLKQAFVNIMTNGCQAMNGNGLLKVGIKRKRNNVEVAIADNGEGISQNDISRIFDPFITSKEMGVGLGLAISKRIIEDHEGTINVQSKLSEGSVFTISLPVKNW